ncbi:MAG: orotate phosphoribosyltransferase [bacterium JZ-2024 1]
MGQLETITELRKIIKTRCYREADEDSFVLASGRRSRYYIDLKKAMLHPPTLALLANALLERLRQGPRFPDGVGGLTLGADPLAYSVCLAAHAQGILLFPFVVRKEEKDHGIKRAIEGLVEPGNAVVVLEDVATTGGSAALAVSRCRDAGLDVLYVLAVVDREEGARERLKEIGVPMFSLFTISDLKS